MFGKWRPEEPPAILVPLKRLKSALRVLRWIVLAGVVIVTVGFAVAWIITRDRVGGTPGGERLERMQASPQWSDGVFGNPLPRVDGPPGEMLSQWFFGGASHRIPDPAITVEPRKGSEFDEAPSSGLRVTWLGHSTLLVEVDGAAILTDPVWGRRVSPFTSLGPERFYEPPLPLDELPKLDAVLISHDHYDHLDYDTVKAMADVDTKWLMPLGIGAHLEQWGIPADRIVELDWWDGVEIGPLTLTCAPARHFSGRSIVFADQNATLWSGWAIQGPQHRVFYSGDTALHPQFADIGERLGPFDVTLIEAGAYNALWADVHLGPEQAVIAHKMLRGRVLIPVHWGLFDLAVHSWTEPMERSIAAAKRLGVTIATPRPGESLELGGNSVPQVERWWPDVPWATVEEEPCWSSSVDELQTDYR